MISSAVLAIIKAHRPTFSSASSSVAFAAHAVLASNAIELLAVGNEALTKPYPDSDAQEVPIDGWDASSSEGEWSFLYRFQENLILLKCIAIDSSLLVTVASVKRSSGSEKAGGPSSSVAPPPALVPAPETATLDTARYCPVTLTSFGPSSYNNDNFQELVDKIQALVDGQLDLLKPVLAKKEAAKVHLGRSELEDVPASSRQGQGVEYEDHDPYAYQHPHPSPLTVGEGDLRPLPYRGGGGIQGPGFIDPMFGGGPRMGGGMHVGPNDPLFAGRHDPLRVPGGGGRGGLPPGARFDPINPEGLPGFNPTDFQRMGARGGRGGPPVHPDVMQPGPGRGADWDSMFG